MLYIILGFKQMLLFVGLGLVGFFSIVSNFIILSNSELKIGVLAVKVC